MSAILSKVGAWFMQYVMKYVMKYVIRYLWDHFTAWQERRRAREEQQKKDQENKPKYDEAVNNGNDQEIEDATEDYLNGR